jgi:hypothetical protein
MEDIHKDHISIFHNALSKEECQTIIDIYELKSKLFKEIPGQRYDHGTGSLRRNDYSQNSWDLPGVSNFVNAKIEKYYELYKKEFFQVESVFIRFNEVKLQKTPIRGAFHDWHCEVGDISTIDRCIVWMIYLNDLPEGEGQTEFLWQGIKVQPKAGTLVIWPAFFTHVHRGNPVYSHSKYIATGWGIYTDQNFDEYYFQDDKGFYHRKLDCIEDE